jgi:solute carrier family 25 (adenine nucleotide translocator) protein 4/5/6/31
MKKRFWKFLAGNLLASGMAGATSLFFTYPLDLARTRLTVGINQSEFRSFSDCLIRIAKSEGLRGLYSGFAASVQGAFVYRVSCFCEFLID